MPSLNFQFSPSDNTALIPCDFASLGAGGSLDLILRREFYAAGATTGTHLHRDFCALYVVKSGRGVHQIDGIPFGIARGDVYLLPPGARHAYTGYCNLEIDAFYFPLDLWSDEELGALREVSGFWHLLLENEARRLHLSPEIYAQVEAFIVEMRAEATTNERATPLLLRALLFRLLIRLARTATQTETAATAPWLHESAQDFARGADVQFAELISWCEANVERDISVAQMAGRLFLSTAHFARGWKRAFGVPPAAYLRRLKLERARALLENSNQSVAHIAREVGFKSAAHFSRAFRAYYGASPLQFRRAAILKSSASPNSL